MKNLVVKDGKPRSALGRLAIFCLSVLLVAALKVAFLGSGLASLKPLSTRAQAAGPDAWVELIDQKPALSLDRTSFAGQAVKITTYVHSDGSRNDWISAGTFPLASPNITFSIVRQTKAKPLTYSVIRNLEDISELRMVRHQYRPTYYALNTRFGELRGVKFDVSADGTRKYCVGFHKPISNMVFVKGFACAPDAADVTPQRVACLVDQIRFINPADEQAMQASLEPDEARECGATALDSTSGQGAKNKTDSL